MQTLAATNIAQPTRCRVKAIARQIAFMVDGKHERNTTRIILLPREAYALRGLCCQDVCPSVCLSVTHRYCVESAKYVIKLFSLPISHHYSFSVPNLMTIYRRRSPNRGVECKGVRKNRHFRPRRPASRFVSDMIQHMAIVTMEYGPPIGARMRSIKRCHFE